MKNIKNIFFNFMSFVCNKVWVLPLNKSCINMGLHIMTFCCHNLIGFPSKTLINFVVFVIGVQITNFLS